MKAVFKGAVIAGAVAMLAACGGDVSDEVITINQAPVANAGNPQYVTVGNVVSLDGSESKDADGDTLSYQWRLTEKPIGSSAVLGNEASVMPTLNVDYEGVYVVTLVVNDGKSNSAAATVEISAERDFSNVTDIEQLNETLISVVALMNEVLLSDSTYLDELFETNSVSFAVPVQNYFSSDAVADVARAEILVTNIKADFPVQASPDKKPYRLSYVEYDSNNSPIYTLRVGSIYGCSNANDVKNPAAECVQYSYEAVKNGVMLISGLGSINLVKTELDGLIYLSRLVE